MTTYNRSRYLKIITFLLTATLFSCNKSLQIDPPSYEITGVTVYSDNGSAAAVMTGLYSSMVISPGFSSGNLSIGYFMGLAADELTNYAPSNLRQSQFYTNALDPGTQGASNFYFWQELYNKIYIANAALEGVSGSTKLSAAIKQQITGEAKFMRAFLHFYATNLYGDIPLVTTTNYLFNDSISRTPQKQVYDQIIADLKDAQSKLSDAFIDAAGNPTSERTRPNQAAASALLARVYLYNQQWDSAETEATMVINNSTLYSLDALNEVFLANSSEAIWQLQPVSQGRPTWDGFYYVLIGPPGGGSSAALDSNLVNSFDSSDARKSTWIGSVTKNSVTYYYPFKYQVSKRNLPVTEYTMVLRLAEQYLIRAESRAEKGDISGAQSDLNTIRTRAGLDSTAANDQASLLTAIMHERQVELFTEWGHRWFDLKRTGNLNSVMGSPGNVCQIKGGSWSPNWALLPIAYQELLINHHLTQNPGY